MLTFLNLFIIMSVILFSFTGNSNLVYTIIRKRNVFHQLANLPTDHSAIAKALSKKGRKLVQNVSDKDGPSMEGSTPAVEAEPGTLKTSLAATPGIRYVLCCRLCLCICAWVLYIECSIMIKVVGCATKLMEVWNTSVCPVFISFCQFSNYFTMKNSH